MLSDGAPSPSRDSFCLSNCCAPRSAGDWSCWGKCSTLNCWNNAYSLKTNKKPAVRKKFLTLTNPLQKQVVRRIMVALGWWCVLRSWVSPKSPIIPHAALLWSNFSANHLAQVGILLPCHFCPQAEWKPQLQWLISHTLHSHLEKAKGT